MTHHLLNFRFVLRITAEDHFILKRIKGSYELGTILLLYMA